MFEPFKIRNVEINKIVAAILTLLFILTTALARPSPDVKQVSLSREGQTEWQRVTPQGGEFSILTPVLPTFLKQGGNYSLSYLGEKILDHRCYSAYADDFIFTIESYKAAKPQRIVKEVDDFRHEKMTLEREITINGFSGKQYQISNQYYYGKGVVLVTKQHVYQITLASRDENNASGARFLSSLMLGDKISEPATGYALDLRESGLYKNALSDIAANARPLDQAFALKDVSRKAVIVSRPEPTYTDDARHNQVKGTVVLRGVFGADGQMRVMRVVQGLSNGLTEKAIEAALAIRFFPAEKDGQRVSQYIQVEYNFDLY